MPCKERIDTLTIKVEIEVLNFRSFLLQRLQRRGRCNSSSGAIPTFDGLRISVQERIRKEYGGFPQAAPKLRQSRGSDLRHQKALTMGESAQKKPGDPFSVRKSANAQAAVRAAEREQQEFEAQLEAAASSSSKP